MPPVIFAVQRNQFIHNDDDNDHGDNRNHQAACCRELMRNGFLPSCYGKALFWFLCCRGFRRQVLVGFLVKFFVLFFEQVFLF